MPAFTASPGALRLFAVSIVARLPLAMLSIGWLVHIEHLTGSFATAGAVAGTLAVAQGVGGPLLGRLADRRGQTLVLVAGAVVAGTALVAGAALPADAPLWAILGLAAVLGLSTPPVGACMRTLLPTVLSDPTALRRAYAIDAAAVELTWATGPPLVLLAGAVWSTGAALTAAGVVLALATLLFAAFPASRSWRPAPGVVRPAGGALRAPGMRTLVLVLLGVGMLFGGFEVAIAAAADALHRTAAAGPLLGLWGLGSLAGGIVAARAGGGARTGAGLAVLLAALAAGHLALAAVAGSLIALAAFTVLAGTMIAPTLATPLGMVDGIAPAGTATEAFAWLATALAIGTSVGAATAGVVAEASGPAATFVLAAGAAAVAAVIAGLRAHTLAPAEQAPAARPALPAQPVPA
jgi:hypothetical protein